MATLADPLRLVVGDRNARLLADALELQTVGDLLRYYPRRYEPRGELTDLASLRDGEHVTVQAEVAAVSVRQMRNRRGSVFEAVVTDGRGRLALTFFGKGSQAWREKELRPGVHGLFSGQVSTFRGKRQLAHPDFELLPARTAAIRAAEFAAELIPIYRASGQIPSWRIAKMVCEALDHLDVEDDPLPRGVRSRYRLCGLADALRGIHRPIDDNDRRRAERRLKWDEAFVLQVVLAQRRLAATAYLATPRPRQQRGMLDAFDASLPFELTIGQQLAGAEIADELGRDHPMHRLLQGEVGSGKTVIALRAMLQVADAGGQAALLAPTEVLAQQHHRSISAMLGPLAQAGQLGGAERATRVALLTGSQSAAARRSALLDAASGAAGIVIGTHALLQEQVQFADLGLVVIDEQHRFGVEQRDTLRAKAGEGRPHVLVMTATPIPRTVAMTVFGDLDISTLTELPAGRSPIGTHVVPAMEKPRYLERTWERLREEVAKGRQAYVVCPRIGADGPGGDGPGADGPGGDGPGGDGAGGDGAGDSGSAKPGSPRAKPAGAADPDRTLDDMLGIVLDDDEPGRPPATVVDLAAELAAGPLAGIRLGVLHGRLPSDEKDRVMLAFAAGSLDVLVTTTVVEVGVDVPNATAMVIMNADRFGVSQLHQLRGRVGRGVHEGLCLLVTDVGGKSRQRLDAVASTLDGFTLSRVDLEQRHEGDVLGAAQAGRRSSLRLLTLLKDEDLIGDARREATELVARDAALADHPALDAAIRALLDEERAEYLEKA
jgi:ATP-dependent DNA helicase RecG